MVALSPITYATSQIEQDDAYYRADRPRSFDQQEEQLNDQGLIQDEEGPALNGTPPSQPLKAQGENCIKQGSGEECQKIEIKN